MNTTAPSPAPPSLPPGSSNREFGFVFSAVCAVIALLPLLDGGAIRPKAGVAAAVFLVLAVAAPSLLAPLNRLWFKFGLLLHRVMTPLVMSILFFVGVTPIALLMRLAGKDPLRLKFSPTATSYWITRDQPGPAPESMKYQF